jgi:uncharacterized RDD family membrane protein YckC
MSQPSDPNQPPSEYPQDPQPPQNPQQPYAGGAPAPYQSAPQVNPYGGGAQAFPGSKAYVEQHFGPVSSFGRRAGALVIDTLLSLIGVIPMVIGTVMLVIAAPDVDELGNTIDGTGNGGQAAVGGLLIALGILLTIGIQIWNRIFRMGRTGQSVGKKMLGLKLINEQTGQPIGAMQSFLRELLGGLINQVVYLSYLWMLWDDNKQTLADKIVHSTVIDVPKS